jgi:hypothetical protein
MSCEDHRQRLSLMMDAEIEGMEQAGLFAHLEGCPGCRQFLDSLIRFRNAARRDREEILLQADELLPAHAPLPATARRALAPAGGPSGRWRERIAGWLRPGLPAPAAILLAVALLAVGIAIGTGLGARREATRIPPDAETAKRPGTPPQVVYVCSMPQVEVTGEAIPGDAR